MIKYLMFSLIFIMSCSTHHASDYKNEKPKINLHQFFSGKIKAHGIVQDRSRKVIKRFVVDINASWKGDIATLDESFSYSDGTTSKRVWTLEDIGENKFIGTAGDVIGNANGETEGNIFFFEYNLKLPVDDTVYHVNFEDWMILLDSKTLLARSYMSKWGFDLAEVTIVMTKEN